MNKKIGVYAGSFNPFHIGHMNIVKKAEKIFDSVIIAVGKNPEKDSNEYFNLRVSKLMSLFPNRVDIISGMLMDFLVSLNDDVTLIRGLRNGFDFNYEQTQLRFLEEMKPVNFDFKVVYIPCDKEYEHISSSSIRAIQKISMKEAEKYLIF